MPYDFIKLKDNLERTDPNNNGLIKIKSHDLQTIDYYERIVNIYRYTDNNGDIYVDKRLILEVVDGLITNKTNYDPKKNSDTKINSNPPETGFSSSINNDGEISSNIVWK
mmetsp:Transcript_7240/g.10652  ORF Transcript_7240/g.10652 Transcript_7240/m.10652 type:complete len:110 (-) Transcript_7240:153-482(-)